jgi:hypothetical protein
MPTSENLGVSTAGHRNPKGSQTDTVQQAAARAMILAEEQSLFFDQAEQYALPSFDMSGAYIHTGLGGSVMFAVSFLDVFSCFHFFFGRVRN